MERAQAGIISRSRAAEIGASTGVRRISAGTVLRVGWQASPRAFAHRRFSFQITQALLAQRPLQLLAALDLPRVGLGH
jgi:hypothetical protein